MKVAPDINLAASVVVWEAPEPRECDLPTMFECAGKVSMRHPVPSMRPVGMHRINGPNRPAPLASATPLLESVLASLCFHTIPSFHAPSPPSDPSAP